MPFHRGEFRVRTRPFPPNSCSTVTGSTTESLTAFIPVTRCSTSIWPNALTKAVNDWQIEHWLEADPRWRASILINAHDVNFSIEEIKRCAQHGGYVQVLMLARTHAPLGRREFWPIYATAQELGLPIGGSLRRRIDQPDNIFGLAVLLHWKTTPAWHSRSNRRC